MQMQIKYGDQHAKQDWLSNCKAVPKVQRERWGASPALCTWAIGTWRSLQDLPTWVQQSLVSFLRRLAHGFRHAEASHARQYAYFQTNLLCHGTGIAASRVMIMRDITSCIMHEHAEAGAKLTILL